MLSLRDKGNCPCPRCLITKKDISQLGMQRDRNRRITMVRKDTIASLQNIQMARGFIYGRSGYKVNSKVVENVLQATSQVPTEVLTLFFFMLIL
jgi:hypothetical protein